MLGSCYRMRKPANPRYPFVISTLTLPQLDLQAKRVAQVLKIASWSLIGIGGALVATRFVRSFWRRYKEARARQDFVRSKKEIEERKRAHLQLTASRSGAEGGGQEDIDIEKLAGFCVVCFERESDCVFSGCGHLCCCSNCSIKIGRKCPICRVHSNSLKVFKS